MSSASASAITVASWSSVPAWRALVERAGDLVAVDDGAVAAEVLRRGDGLVGRAQQADAVARRGPATVATPKLNFTPDGGLGEAAVGGAAQPLGDDEGAALVRLREQQRELLARDARRDVDAPLPLERVPRDRLERRVAGRVPVLLVHLAERVDVADDHGHRAVAAQGALELQLEQLLEGAAVEQPGERVGAVRVGDALARASRRRLRWRTATPASTRAQAEGKSGARMPAGSISPLLSAECFAPLKW